MLKLIQKHRNFIQAHRSKENGFTLIELIVAMLLLTILMTISLYAVIVSSRSASAFVQHAEGVNQGVTSDAVRSAFKAAKDFRADYPDIPVNNENLTTYGYMPTDIPPSVKWGVGQDDKFSDNTANAVCAVAFSLSEDEGKYSEAQPVEINDNQQGQYLLSRGCWGTVYEGTELDPVTGETKEVWKELHVANGLNEAEVKQRNSIVSPMPY